jgi:Tfp pilus assembly protein PilP
MKLTTGILAVVMMTGAAWGQNPGANDNTGSGKSPQQTKANDTNATLAAAVPAAKPAPGAPAPAVKPAIIPGAKPAAAAPAQAAAKPASAASRNNTLDKVSVVRKGDDVQIEISSREAVTPKVTKLTSPVRVLVELPETAMATAQNKIPVGSAGVKGVRIGMDGKTPPTTSVVVDLEQAYAYEVTPGPGNKLVLTLHTKGAAPVVAKSTPAAAPAPAKTAAPAPKQTASAKPVAAPQAPAPAKTSTPAAKTVAMTPAAVPAAKSTPALATAKPAATAPVVAGKVEAPKTAAKPAPATTKIAAKDTEKPAASGKPEAAKTAEAPKAPKPEEKKWAMNGKRDPFFSPVVQQTAGSGCSTGKKCLDIGQINLRGVVKSESGFIAVVTNSLNKAYFLHENDPVFNGYVVRITGDSVVFQETVQDKLGKPLTREVVKRIFTPAV